MKKVTIGEIQKQIYENRRDLIISYLSEGHTEIPYKFQNFEKDMLMSELVVDPRTIRNKWKLMVVSGTVRETSEKKGYLSIPALSKYMSEPLSRRLALIERGRESERETHARVSE